MERIGAVLAWLIARSVPATTLDGSASRWPAVRRLRRRLRRRRMVSASPARRSAPTVRLGPTDRSTVDQIEVASVALLAWSIVDASAGASGGASEASLRMARHPA